MQATGHKEKLLLRRWVESKSHDAQKREVGPAPGEREEEAPERKGQVGTGVLSRLAFD